MLADIYGDFGLDTDKVVGTVTDNGTNFVKAFKEFGVDSQTEGKLVTQSQVTNTNKAISCQMQFIP